MQVKCEEFIDCFLGQFSQLQLGISHSESTSSPDSGTIRQFFEHVVIAISRIFGKLFMRGTIRHGGPLVMKYFLPEAIYKLPEVIVQDIPDELITGFPQAGLAWRCEVRLRQAVSCGSGLQAGWVVFLRAVGSVYRAEFRPQMSDP
jgi:hypothetical protein